MNPTQYKEYKDRVAAFLRREDIRTITTKYDEEGSSEPFFSWRSCDCCGSYLGGDRYDMIALVGDDIDAENMFDYQVCCDCLYFLEYGRLDDRTMLEMEDKK